MVLINCSTGIGDIKVFQDISVFFSDQNSRPAYSVYMFNAYSTLFKINLGNKINGVCHCYQTYCKYYFTILHQAQNHYQN